MEPVNELEFWKQAAETQKNNNLKLLEENRKLREGLDREKSEWLEVMRREQSERTELFKAIQSIQQERDKLQLAVTEYESWIKDIGKPARQQVNTLTEETKIAVHELERLERTLFLGLPEKSHARKCYSAVVNALTEALQSIKESPREEQTP